MKAKLFSVLALILVGVIALSGLVSAVPVVIEEVKVDGDVLDPTSTNTINNYDRGENLNIRVKLEALEDVENLELEVEMDGYEHGDVEARTDVFDLNVGETERFDLSLKLPEDMDKGMYQLKVTVRARFGPNEGETYDIKVKTPRHNLKIEDVVFSPSYSVKAGRALLATVRLENTGSKDEDGIRVKVSVPELGMEATDYMDELESDDETSSEELYMRVPNCAEAGEYEANVEVTFDDGHEKVTETRMITVVDGGVCDESPAAASGAQTTGKTIIAVGPESQDVRKGEGGAVYPVTLTNTGTVTKTYTVGVQSAPGLDVRVSPSNLVVLDGGASKAVYVYVSATEAASAGEQLFALQVNSGDETLKEVTLKANVAGEATAAGWSKVKKGLEVGLIVLVVLLVILGLVIGFNKLKGDEEEVEAGQTYY